MRKVKFNKWVPIQRIGDIHVGKAKEGTNCWQTDFPNEGLFHQWAASYDEFESGAGNFTVALIEMPDGTIQEVLPRNLMFID